MRPLIYLLLILIFVVQPASVLADVHQLHQHGATHQSFEHDNQNLEHNIYSGERLTNKRSGPQLDCHHCCHCHGVACGVGVPVTQVLECEYGNFIPKSDYAARVYPFIYEKQFRPPRI